MLKKILEEVKSTNVRLTRKIDQLEKRVTELSDEGPSRKKKKLMPSPEVRVCEFSCY